MKELFMWLFIPSNATRVKRLAVIRVFAASLRVHANYRQRALFHAQKLARGFPWTLLRSPEVSRGFTRLYESAFGYMLTPSKALCVYRTRKRRSVTVAHRTNALKSVRSPPICLKLSVHIQQGKVQPRCWFTSSRCKGQT